MKLSTRQSMSKSKNVTQDELAQLQRNLEKLGRSIRDDLESQVQIVEKTITVDGIEHTVQVKMCPKTYGTGLAGQVLYGRAMFGDKKVNRTAINRFLQFNTNKVKAHEKSSGS